ncbi:MAG TPA: GlsB/YeaQ/YmgE family stress response membrane protein [Candidatus Saccharimonadales bacterium]|nr:GlsB/YeaQ/YmgE family stress response membrane protein [Candidatus Saccharimonadales bacterium]
MGIIAFLILGAIVGWLAAAVMGRREGVLGSMIIGIVGAFLGSILSYWTTGADRAYLAFSWSGLFWSFIGAIVLVAILNALQRPRHTHTY